MVLEQGAKVCVMIVFRERCNRHGWAQSQEANKGSGFTGVILN